ncbi:MAG: prefoldin subunit [archaeon]
MSNQEEQIAQLQVIEQNLTNSMMQRQTFQNQILEIKNALKELENAKGKNYKILGGIMIESNKNDLIKELNENKDVLDLRLKTIKKQEDSLKDKAQAIQKEVMDQLQKEKK